MKSLLSTTFLVAAFGLPGMMLADTARTEATPATAQLQVKTPEFLGTRGQSDIFVTDLMGHDVHALSSPGDVAGASRPTSRGVDQAQDMTTMSRARIDAMENIGRINEIVLSGDGRIRAIVIGVGDFLGMGQRDIAVPMDQVTLASDPEDRAQMYVVINTSVDVLLDSPRFERVAIMTNAPVQTGRAAAAAEPMTGRATMRPEERPMNLNVNRTADQAADQAAERDLFSAPDLTLDGYSRVNVTEVTTEMLVGESVYDVNDTIVGSVTDMIIDDEGMVTEVIINFGGFLGIGTSHVGVGFDELTVLANATSDDVRIFIDATKEQVQAQPEYRLAN